jgi:AcrR family transcriptional regulator
MSLGSPSAHRLSPAQRRQRNREEMVDTILEAAREVMRKDGVAALNLQEVARRVRIKAPSLYEYFPSKLALYDALFRLGISLWSDRVNDLLGREFETPWDLIHAILEAYVDFGDDHPEMYKLVHERHVPGFEPSPEALGESTHVTQLGVAALKSWMDRGALVIDLAPEEAFDLVIVVLHGLAGAHVADKPGDRSPSSRYRRLIPAATHLFEASWAPSESPPSPRARKPKRAAQSTRSRRAGKERSSGRYE